MAHLHELGLLKNVLAFLVLLALLKSSLLHQARGSRPCLSVDEKPGQEAGAGPHILPAEHSIAASAIDVSNCVQACHKQPLLLWAQCDIHPVRESHSQAGLTMRSLMMFASKKGAYNVEGLTHD